MLLHIYLKLWCHVVIRNNIMMYSKSVHRSLRPI